MWKTLWKTGEGDRRSRGKIEGAASATAWQGNKLASSGNRRKYDAAVALWVRLNGEVSSWEVTVRRCFSRLLSRLVHKIPFILSWSRTPVLFILGWILGLKSKLLLGNKMRKKKKIFYFLSWVLPAEFLKSKHNLHFACVITSICIPLSRWQVLMTLTYFPHCDAPFLLSLQHFIF